jgi:hypothetical protein
MITVQNHATTLAQTTRVLFCETPQQHAELLRKFRQMGLRAKPVYCTTSEGRKPGFRLSMAAFIFLTTLQLVHPN